MSTLTAPAVDLAALTLATPRAFEIQPGDLIGVSGDWCTVAAWPIPDAPVNPMFVEIEITPLDRPDRPRPWQILYNARMAVLRGSTA